MDGNRCLPSQHSLTLLSIVIFMPSNRNIQQLADLKDRVSKAKSVVFTDNSGLNALGQAQLREKVVAVGGEMVIAKNTLLKLTLQQIMTNDEFRMRNDRSTFNVQRSAFLSGPTAVLFAYQDEILPIKVLAEFSKANEKPVIKGGLLGTSPLSVQQVMELAKLPGKLELLVKLMQQMQGPIYGFLNVLNGNMNKLVWALEAIETQSVKLKSQNLAQSSKLSV